MWDLFEICADVSILLVLSLTLYVVICFFFPVPYSMQKFTQQKGRWSQGKATDVPYITTFLWSLRYFNLSSSLLRFFISTAVELVLTQSPQFSKSILIPLGCSSLAL